jgi:hypothetical protein
VSVAENAGSGAPFAAVLVAGGLPVAEVTFRIVGAVEVLRAMGGTPGGLVSLGDQPAGPRRPERGARRVLGSRWTLLD